MQTQQASYPPPPFPPLPKAYFIIAFSLFIPLLRKLIFSPPPNIYIYSSKMGNIQIDKQISRTHARTHISKYTYIHTYIYIQIEGRYKGLNQDYFNRANIPSYEPLSTVSSKYINSLKSYNILNMGAPLFGPYCIYTIYTYIYTCKQTCILS